MPGYHTWPYWDRAIKTALPDIAAHLGADQRPMTNDE
jgi:S-formylglutathione hydrolase FrmB